MRLYSKQIVVLLLTLLLSACGMSSLGFSHLDYPISQKPLIGKMVLILPKSVTNSQFTIPAATIGAEDDQIVNAGQMLLKMADYDFPKRFTSYQRLNSMKDIKPGFYLAIVSLDVSNFVVVNRVVEVTLHAKMYSYQGKLLYEKSFVGRGRLGKAMSLQQASLIAYRQAMMQVNNRLRQVLYWEQHQGIGNPK